MSRPPAQEEWDEAFSASNERDPMPEHWGIFAYSDAPPPVCGSGLGSFHWFRTQPDLVAFIRDYMAWWNPAPSSMEPEEIAAKVQEIVDAESADLSRMIDRLNEFMRSMWQIGWCGQCREMCQGDGEFPVKIREAYREDEKPASTEPIPSDRIGDFVEFLRTYGH